MLKPSSVRSSKQQIRPTVLDLFAGCGGMSLGLESAGFDIACSVEFDPVHSLIHHYNFPYTATICKDVSDVSSKEIYSRIRQLGYMDIDVVVGGPPCQGFSHIGKRQLDDKRNKLVFEYVRLISEIKPKYFIFENVPGIASGKHQQFLEELLADFKRLGYNVSSPYRVLDASNYGVAQARKRLILIGSRKDMPLAIYPDPTHGIKHVNESLFGDSLHPIVGASEAIGDLSLLPVFLDDDTGIKNKLKYTSYSYNFSFDYDGVFSKCHRRDVENIVFNHVGSKHTKESVTRFASAEQGTNEEISRFFKLHPNRPCNTLRAGTNSDHGAHTAPRPIHYRHPRCISVREGARLHSFPDWFQFHRTIWHGFREIGNAVAPMLARSLGLSLIDAMGLSNAEFEVKHLKRQDDELLHLTMTEASNYWGVDRGVIPVRRRIVNE
jgi:DNA (cytosine-5)-methyltransferase 1